MSEGWENYDPAPIEVFHGEALERFHELAEEKGMKLLHPGWGKEVNVLDGSGFSVVIAEFKVKIMKHYGITSDPIPKGPK